MNLRNWLALVLSTFVVDAYFFGSCPVNKYDCKRQNNNEYCCKQVGVDEFNIRCSSRNISSTLNLMIKRESKFEVSAIVNCSNTHEWPEFLYGSTFNLGRVKNLVFYSCNHFQNSSESARSMKDVLEDLGVITVERVEFQNLALDIETDVLNVFSNATSINLSNNIIGKISRDFLQGLAKLRQLHFLRNVIKGELQIGMFENTLLELLEFEGNQMVNFKSGTFNGLQNLTSLYLRDNGIEDLNADVFDNLISLQTMDLSKNSLKTLPPKIFRNLKNLRQIDLSSNNFSSLPMALFAKNINLSNIRLIKNKQNLTHLPSKFLSNIPSLREVSFIELGLTELPEDLFWGSQNIESLTIAKNFLKTLPGNIFRDMSKLTKLYLFSNNFTKLHNDTFTVTTKLKHLDLSNNRLTSINRVLFVGLEKLEVLKMENNELLTIDFNAFSNAKERLRVAKFSHNRLKFNHIDHQDRHLTPFHRLVRIQELYLAHNDIEEMFPVHTLSLLRNLDLSYNSLQELTLLYLQNSANVDLRHNKITRINMENVEYMLKDSIKNLTVHLDDNPVDCNCELYEFLRYFKGDREHLMKSSVYIDAKNLTCHSPNEMRSIKISNIEPISFKCHTSNIDATSDDPCSSEGPCECWNRPHDKTMIIDCSRRNLTQQPVLVNATAYERVDLNLEGNFLKEINLNSNKSGYENITSLNLAMNNISIVNSNHIPLKLKILQLHGNNLTALDDKFIKALLTSKLQNISLYDNPWICDCSMGSFLSFVQSNFKIISDRKHIRCLHSNSSLIDLTTNDLCVKSQKLIILIGTLVAVFGLIIGTAAALYYRFQQEVKIWLFSKNICIWLIKEEEVDSHKMYDAFISYSHKDEDFVLKELITKLEGGPKPYKLCVHFRDWVAGDYIPTQIARSVEEAKRTIVVLSPNFLESVWGRLEFQAAHKQALSEKRARVIIIVYGDLGPIDRLDSELRAYMQTNTYVKWGDPWFWQKLYYALPHARDFEKRNGGIRLDARKSKKINMLEKEVEEKAVGYGLVNGE